MDIIESSRMTLSVVPLGMLIILWTVAFRRWHTVEFKLGHYQIIDFNRLQRRLGS